MRIYKLIGLLLGGLIATVYAQTGLHTLPLGGLTNPVTNAYGFSALGVNPSLLALPLPGKEFAGPASRWAGSGTETIEKSARLSLGFAEFAIAGYIQALNKRDFNDIVFNRLMNQNFQMTLQEKKEFAKQFQRTAISLDWRFTWLGISFRDKRSKWGVGATVRDEFSFYLYLDSFVTHLALLGLQFEYFDTFYITPQGDTIAWTTNPINFSEAMEDTRLYLSQTRRFSVGGSYQVYATKDIQAWAGLGVNYIMGFSYGEAYALPDGIIAHGATAYLTDSFTLAVDTANKRSFIELKPLATGVSFDIGGVIRYKQNLMVSFSILDLMGKLNWKQHVVRLEDALIDTLINYQGPGSTGNIGGGWSNIYRITTLQQKLPVTLQVGATYQVMKMLSVSGFLSIPIRKAVGFLPEFRAGVIFQPINLVTVETGFAVGGRYPFRIPLGLRFGLGPRANWQIGIATYDFLGVWRNRGPLYSLGLAFLRFQL
ncbi:MAG: hypothetical protein GXO48_05190 [Chlorobi bacterium]|nr:hypothetical protein [Chlorobiota bacterium]